MKKQKTKAGLVAMALCLAAGAHAGVYSETKSAQAVLAVAPAEMPERAASFVSHKQASAQSDAAVGAMKAAIALNPAGAAAVLASIVKAAPATAPEVTAAAVAGLPKQGSALAQIGAKNAPAYAARISARLAKQDPRNGKRLAEAIAEIVPVATQEILLAADTASRPADRIPGAPSEVTKALDSITVGGAPYQGGNTVALNTAGLSTENNNTSRGYAAP